MKRGFVIFLTIVAIISIVVVAGYLGLQRARGSEDAVPVEPVTVRATRGDVEQTVVAPGRVVATGNVVLAPRVGGRVMSVVALPGYLVSAGDILVQLDRLQLEEDLDAARLALEQAAAQHDYVVAEAKLNLRIAEARVMQATAQLPSTAAAEASLAVAEAELQLARRGASEGEVLAAEADLANADVNRRLAQAAYDRVSHRADIGALPESVELQKATNAHIAAQARYDSVLVGPDPALVASAEARRQQALALLDGVRAERGAAEEGLAMARTDVQLQQLALRHLGRGIDPALMRAINQAEANLAATSITAPFDGVVLEVAVRPGESVVAGSPVVVLSDPSAIEIVATIIEEDLPSVAIGQLVEVFFDAAPDEDAVAGTVTRIVPQRTDDARPLYPVYISVDVVPSGIAPGMTADGSIIIDKRVAVLRLPKALVRARSDGSAQVEVWTGDAVQARTVQVGLRGDAYVEIVHGMNEGEAVVAQ